MDVAVIGAFKGPLRHKDYKKESNFLLGICGRCLIWYVECHYHKMPKIVEIVKCITNTSTKRFKTENRYHSVRMKIMWGIDTDIHLLAVKKTEHSRSTLPRPIPKKLSNTNHQKTKKDDQYEMQMVSWK